MGTGGETQAAAQTLSEQSTGIMSSIFNKGAQMADTMATAAVGSGPELNLEINAPPDERLYFINGDEISGALSIVIPNEVIHHGIKVIMRGLILSQSKAQYEFIQLTRDLDGPGTLMPGTFDYKFQFKNVDMDVDSYTGILLDVRFEVQAEMMYEGSISNYTAIDSRIFQVRNTKNTTPITTTTTGSEAVIKTAVVHP